ncbi:MAG: hypothetical protein O2819_03130 [Planctomycetota bacterium]|nr:hypothetical protein [Planctomycetota bacterium]MDA1105732.1 hypothetical protein [Planctomycetota bacterium]
MDTPHGTPLPPRTQPKGKSSGENRNFLLFAIRLVFIVLLVVVSMLVVSSTRTVNEFGFTTVAGIIIAAMGLGLAVVMLDALTPRKRLTSLVGAYLGLCLGLVAAIAIGTLIDTISNSWELTDGGYSVYLPLSKVIIGIILCYLSVSIVLTTKDDFRLVIPYVEFSKQVRGVRPIVLDTSVLVDGRVELLASSHFLDAPLIVPEFVLAELQALGDSADRLKRAKGRRGLETVSRLQAAPLVDVEVDPSPSDGRGVDSQLIDLAQREGHRILTLDAGLAKVGTIRGIQILSLHELSSALQLGAGIGEGLQVEIVRRGDQRLQGVAFTPDGMMVVIEDGATRVGETVEVEITNTVKTAAGTMHFARIKPLPTGLAHGVQSQVKHAGLGPRATSDDE